MVDSVRVVGQRPGMVVRLPEWPLGGTQVVATAHPVIVETARAERVCVVEHGERVRVSPRPFWRLLGVVRWRVRRVSR
jgi:hypothetical protein